MKIVIRKSVYEEIMKSHKYISRWLKDGRWEYQYPKDQPRNVSRKEAVRNIAKKTPVIFNISPLTVFTKPAVQMEMDKLKNLSSRGMLRCPALGNSNIEIDKKSFNHIFFSKGVDRPQWKIQQKSMYLPYVPEILKNGKISCKSYRKEGLVYGVVCRANVNGKIVNIEVAIRYNEEEKKCYLSIAD